MLRKKLKEELENKNPDIETIPGNAKKKLQSGKTFKIPGKNPKVKFRKFSSFFQLF